MSVTAATLVARYPEFGAAVSDYPDMVDACIAQATEMVDATVYSTKADHAIKALAAHLIAINPMGEMARLDKKGTKTVYLLQYEQLRKMPGAGFRVI
jgi:hypothetical protein